jgi:TatA/E family protein of Tat protein translocase
METLLFLDISGGELLIIVVAVFLIFGPKKVPEIARQMGKVMNELKKTTNDLSREFKAGANQVKSDFADASTGFLEEKTKIEREIGQVTEQAIPQTLAFKDPAFDDVYAKTESHSGNSADSKATPPPPDGLLF